MDPNDSQDSLTTARLMAIWWAFVWRCAVFGGIMGAVLGFVGGFLAASMGRGELSTSIGALMGYLASIPTSMVVLRHVLQKRFRTFEIRITPPSGSQAIVPPAAN